MSIQMSTIGRAALAAALVLATSASLAFAAEVSSAEYKEAVEPICHANAKASERILSGIRKEVKESKLNRAASQFAKAADALNRTYRELNAVPQPSADEAELDRWLSYVRQEVELLRQISQSLKEGKRAKADRYVAALARNAQRANAAVLDFEFRWCRFQPSKYT